MNIWSYVAILCSLLSMLAINIARLIQENTSIVVCETEKVETCKQYKGISDVVELKDSVKFTLSDNVLTIPGHVLKVK